MSTYFWLIIISVKLSFLIALNAFALNKNLRVIVLFFLRVTYYNDQKKNDAVAQNILFVWTDGGVGMGVIMMLLDDCGGRRGRRGEGGSWEGGKRRGGEMKDKWGVKPNIVSYLFLFNNFQLTCNHILKLYFVLYISVLLIKKQ